MPRTRIAATLTTKDNDRAGEPSNTGLPFVVHTAISLSMYAAQTYFFLTHPCSFRQEKLAVYRLGS